MVELEFHGQVSHRLHRARVLAGWRAGRIQKETLCDAEFLLVAAADFHGVAMDTPCPICGEDQLRSVLWVYGEQLGRKSGSARSLEEIHELRVEGREFTVHRVEVCSSCRWNHLLEAAVLSNN